MILGFLAIALISVSCSKNEVSSVNNDVNAINFDVTTGKTRANVVDLAGLQGVGFGVFATNTSSSLTFIGNEGYVYVGGAWKWDTTNPIMWPTTETDFPINFYAYYPKTETTLTSALTANYTIAATPAAQIDFLAANQTDVIIRPSSGNVSLAFKHMLSKINFKVVTGTHVTVEVQSITVKNAGNTGTFNYAALGWSTLPSSGTLSYNYMQAPLNDPANVFIGATTATAVTGSSGSLMLMPQDFSSRAWNNTVGGLANQSYIEVVYRIYETATGKDVVGLTDATDHAGNSDSHVNGSLFVKVGYSLSTNWLMGKAYTYTIYLGDGSSGGSLVDDKYVDEDGNGTDLPVGPGITDPIFPLAPIGFNVSVEDWGNENGIPLE